MKEKIKIAVVDDHTLFRSGLVSLMNEFEEIEIAFEASNGLALQQAVKKFSCPQLVIMDINMPQMDGYEATEWLHSMHPEVKVLALSMYEDEKAIIRMIKAGAGGYILKESTPQELLHAIKIIVEKGFYINDMVSGRLIYSLQQEKRSGLLSLPAVTEKEREFLTYCSTELTYKEIAVQMSISPRTIDSYRENLFQKLNIKSRVGLVIYAIKNKIVEL